MAAACQRRLALRARRVLGADGVGAARPGACGEPDHRLALRARRRGRCAPVHRAGQPLAAIADSRYALSAEGVGAARPVACGSRVAASRYALGAEGVGATRPGEYICSHPDACARCLLVVGMSKTSCASRCSRRSVQGASRSCRGRGWVGTPRGPHCRRCRHARAERRHGGSRHEGGARAASPPRQGLAPPARRPRAAGAPWEVRARAARFKRARWAPMVGPPPQGATRRQLFSRARLPHSVDWVSIN